MQCLFNASMRGFLKALRVPLSGGRPFFLKPKRQTRAAMWTLKTPTKLSMCTLLGADHFGAYQLCSVRGIRMERQCQERHPERETK